MMPEHRNSSVTVKSYPDFFYCDRQVWQEGGRRVGSSGSGVGGTGGVRWTQAGWSRVEHPPQVHTIMHQGQSPQHELEWVMKMGYVALWRFYWYEKCPWNIRVYKRYLNGYMLCVRLLDHRQINSMTDSDAWQCALSFRQAKDEHAEVVSLDSYLSPQFRGYYDPWNTTNKSLETIFSYTHS